MPWSNAQVRLFAAAAHNPAIAKAHHMSQHDARKMEMEAPQKQRSSAMRGRHMANAIRRRNSHA